MRSIIHMISAIFTASPAAGDHMPARESMLYRAASAGRRRARHAGRDRRVRFAPASVPRATRAGWEV